METTLTTPIWDEKTIRLGSEIEKIIASSKVDLQKFEQLTEEEALKLREYLREGLTREGYSIKAAITKPCSDKDTFENENGYFSLIAERK